MKNLLFSFFFMTCFFVKTYGQSNTFEKIITVSTTNRVELLDGENQALKAGRLYRVQLTTTGTGTRTGAEYLIWFSYPENIWRLRMVSAGGNTTNHPILEVIDDVVKLYTNHATAYAIKVYGQVFSSGNAYSIPSMFGSSFQWQRFVNNIYYMDGNVGIGTDIPKEKLSVNGNIRAHQIKVETSNWPDYVFKDDYQLPSLAETEKFIAKNGHLPEVPKAEEVEKDGYSLNEMDKILLKKVEELTLLLIEKDKQLKQQNDTIEGVLTRLNKLEGK